MHRQAGEMLDALTTDLHELMRRTPPNRTFIVSGLHRLWPSRCADGVRSACALCNAPSKEARMREAIVEAVACAAVEGRGRGHVVQLFDTLGLTSTSEAMRDGSDALHYGANTSRAQAHVLLRMICAAGTDAPPLAARPPTPRGCCRRAGECEPRAAAFDRRMRVHLSANDAADAKACTCAVKKLEKRDDPTCFG